MTFDLLSPSHSQQRFGIKTAGLDDKCTAMQMLVVYAKDLGEGFANYAEPVSRSCDLSHDQSSTPINLPILWFSR